MAYENICIACMSQKGENEICPVCGYAEGGTSVNPLFLVPRTLLNHHYLVGKVLGHGGFGITYLAWDFNLEIKLAIKEYFPHHLAVRMPGGNAVTTRTDKDRDHFIYGQKRFLEEARLLAKFNSHPSVVWVSDFFEEIGTAYLVMEYMEGITFKDHLDQSGGRIPYEEAFSIMSPIIDALRQIHLAGLLHRDISPENIYITKEKRVKLLDFGAARYAAGEKSRNFAIFFKPGYTPWEQYLADSEQGPWTDIYAVGASIYRAITGMIPPDALSRVEADTLKKPSEIGIHIPSALEDILFKAMALRVVDRYQNMAEFQKAITTALNASKHHLNVLKIKPAQPSLGYGINIDINTVVVNSSTEIICMACGKIAKKSKEFCPFCQKVLDDRYIGKAQ